MKKIAWGPLKEILFIYLAVNQIYYWFSIVISTRQDGLGSLLEFTFERFLLQDMFIIMGIIVFYYLEKIILSSRAKVNKVVKYALIYGAGYLVLGAITLAYLELLRRIFPLPAEPFSQTFIIFTLLYLSVIIMLEVREYFQSKKALKQTSPTDLSDKISLLETLLKDGILTQEEFDSKKKKILTPN
ncbi:MAG: SHOCT domain-containing protein [Coriobacteriia bacterium]|nr:SHOCT domain-containing protein [Coriobacteriia bacterium]